MKLLIDDAFPNIQNTEPPADVSFVSCDMTVTEDHHLVQYASDNGFRGVVFFDQRTLAQPNLCQKAKALGITLVAVSASYPMDARQQLLHNAERLRKLLRDAEPKVLVVYANEVRPFRLPD